MPKSRSTFGQFARNHTSRCLLANGADLYRMRSSRSPGRCRMDHPGRTISHHYPSTREIFAKLSVNVGRSTWANHRSTGRPSPLAALHITCTS